MKNFKEFKEGFFSKKEKEDPDQKELEDLGMKSAGRGGWSEKEQEKYNDLWMKMHKKGMTPTLQPPSVHGDDSWELRLRNFRKNLSSQQEIIKVYYNLTN